MVEIKVQSDEIAFRVFCLAPGLRDATENVAQLLRSLEPAANRGLEVIHADGDRIVSFRHEPRGESSLFDMKVAFYPCAISMPVSSRGNLKLMIQGADVILLDARAGRDGVTPDVRESRRNLELLLAETGRDPRSYLVAMIVDDPATAMAESMGQGGREPRFLPPLGNLEAAFSRLQSDLLADGRRWEKELRERGLDRHIKIRDRVWEKVLIPWDVSPRHPESGSEMPSTQDVRLVNVAALPPARPFVRRSVIFVLLVLLLIFVAFEWSRRL